jgi:hypothetical protein
MPIELKILAEGNSNLRRLEGIFRQQAKSRTQSGTKDDKSGGEGGIRTPIQLLTV